MTCGIRRFLHPHIQGLPASSWFDLSTSAKAWPAVGSIRLSDIFGFTFQATSCIHGGVSEVTPRLGAVEPGGSKAADELLPLVYDELRKLAAHQMAGEAPGQTLQPTALVHEAWLRLGGSPGATFANRAHFFAAAATAMRRILVDRARRRAAL
jgi:hypothetical protein